MTGKGGVGVAELGSAVGMGCRVSCVRGVGAMKGVGFGPQIKFGATDPGRLGGGVGCCSRRDTRGKRGYDGGGGGYDGIGVGCRHGVPGGRCVRGGWGAGAVKGVGFGPQIKFGATDPEAGMTEKRTRVWRRRGAGATSEVGGGGGGAGAAERGHGCSGGGGAGATEVEAWVWRRRGGRRLAGGGGEGLGCLAVGEPLEHCGDGGVGAAEGGDY